MDIKQIRQPLNAQEEYLYATVVRLDALCNMMSSLIEHIAKKDEVATTTNVEEVKKPAPRKRAPAKKKVE